jgi:deoxycytidylate deaminase
MGNHILAAVILVVATLIVSGCKKQEQCAPNDSPAVCKVVQQCFRSGTSVEVCREAEKEANAIESNKKHF